MAERISLKHFIFFMKYYAFLKFCRFIHLATSGRVVIITSFFLQMSINSESLLLLGLLHHARSVCRHWRSASSGSLVFSLVITFITHILSVVVSLVRQLGIRWLLIQNIARILWSTPMVGGVCWFFETKCQLHSFF